MTTSPPLWKRVGWVLARVLGAPLAPVALWVLRLSSRKRGVALVYHGVEDRPGHQDELVPAMATVVFERQVRHLARHYRIVPASEFRTAVERRRRGERFPVALTFDDDLRCHVAVLLPVFEPYGARGTFFLTGASLEQPRSFWWERLERAVALGARDLAALVGMPDADARPTVGELGAFVRQLASDARAAVDARLAEVAGADPPDAGLRVTDVRRLVEAGNEVGFHTFRHDNLVLLPDDALAVAMVEGREALASVGDAPRDHRLSIRLRRRAGRECRARCRLLRGIYQREHSRTRRRSAQDRPARPSTRPRRVRCEARRSSRAPALPLSTFTAERRARDRRRRAACGR